MVEKMRFRAVRRPAHSHTAKLKCQDLDSGSTAESQYNLLAPSYAMGETLLLKYSRKRILKSILFSATKTLILELLKMIQGRGIGLG